MFNFEFLNKHLILLMTLKREHCDVKSDYVTCYCSSFIINVQIYNDSRNTFCVNCEVFVVLLPHRIEVLDLFVKMLAKKRGSNLTPPKSVL